MPPNSSRPGTGPIALAVLLVLSGCLAPIDTGDLAAGRDKVIAPCILSLPFGLSEGGPPDPPTDRLGWEAGVWHNESIAYDATDGVTCLELERLVARTMARVELLRELEFESTPRVEIISREAFSAELVGGVEPRYRQFQNAKYEALFLVDEPTDAVEAQRTDRSTSVAGYYAVTEDRLVMITEDVSRPVIDDGIFAHEFTHALQDQHFEEFDRTFTTEDEFNADRGLIEGDANYVEYLYERRCEEEWDDCSITDRPPRDRSTLASPGMYVITIQPYSDGPGFVRHVRESGGWAAVNDLYRRPPASSEQIIHPEAYPEDVPSGVASADRDTSEWRRLTLLGRLDHDRLGEAALYAMFLAPVYENESDAPVPLEHYRNENERGELDEFDPYNHSHPYSDGWAGDRFVPYENEAGELGYVWRIAFETEADAVEFVEGYRRLLAFYGAEPVEGRRDVLVIPEGRPYADAFRIERSGDTVTVVNAPTVEALSELY